MFSRENALMISSSPVAREEMFDLRNCQFGDGLYWVSRAGTRGRKPVNSRMPRVGEQLSATALMGLEHRYDA